METKEIKNKENKLRRQLRKMGYYLMKSRIRNPHLDDFGGYRIIDPHTNFIEAGPKFELSLEDVENFVKE